MALTHDDVINKLAAIGNSHVDIKTHYRWNLAEFFDQNANLRPGTSSTLMTYESPTVIPSNSENNIHLQWNCAFNILGKEGVHTYEIDNEPAQNEVVNHCLEIALETYRKLIADTSIPLIDGVPNPWYGVLQKLSASFTKIGPVSSESLYGYRCEFVLNPKFNCNINPQKWE